ncbi:hypothetical protein BWR17_19290 (plasmid) [Phaeobacter inhibens]|uniref:LysR family transcriptional regulator n=1 Tax=Phaeobacter inhibens TaxID=221822 RepID=UPI00097186C6|nr:LysR family transcriptional regulator [Phaeobacter inhibens]APX18033.1 hypothetical protein BWR17_19290 [Phaeobacter inhibens]
MSAFANLPLLRRFLAVARSQSLHQAADALNMTQPALTRSMHHLEEEVGGALLDRSSRGIQLTDLGQLFLPSAKEIIAATSRAEADFQQRRNKAATCVRISAAPVWTSTILPPVAAAMASSAPDLNLKMTRGTAAAAIEDLKTGDIDMYCGGISDTRALPSFLVRRSLYRSSLAFVVHEAHPLAQEIFAPVRLMDFPWLHYFGDVDVTSCASDWLVEMGGRTLEPAVVCPSVLSALDFLHDSPFVTCLPVGFCQSRIGAGLVSLRHAEPIRVFDSGLIYRRSFDGVTGFDLLLDGILEVLRAKNFDMADRT